MGKAVAGYDRVSTPLTDQLVKEGMIVLFKDNISGIRWSDKKICRALYIKTEDMRKDLGL
jgi:hypothetical protein